MVAQEVKLADSQLIFLLEKMQNIEKRQHAMEIDLIDYMESSPKSSDQWQEERLRALESQVKTLLSGMGIRESDIEYLEKLCIAKLIDANETQLKEILTILGAT